MVKAMPLDFDGKAQNYRDYRRRLELFRKLCKRRGVDCESEGALTFVAVSAEMLLGGHATS